MRLFFKFISLFIIASTLISCDEPITAEILEYGVYKDNSDVINQKNPATFSGNVVLTKGEPILIEKTNQVPLQLGTIFRFCFVVNNLPKDKGMIGLNLKLEYPEMEKPDDTKSTGFEFVEKNEVIKGVVVNCNGYILNKAYELVSGVWRFTYSYNNNVLLQQEFHTYEL